MDWNTFIISILSSGVLAALVTALVNGHMNHRTQIQAIKESGLYAKRADVLDQFIVRIEELNRALERSVGTEEEITMKAEVSRAYHEFNNYYLDHRHYLPEDLAISIEELNLRYSDVLIDLRIYTGAEVRFDIKEWRSDFATKREHFVKEFRKLIGVK